MHEFRPTITLDSKIPGIDKLARYSSTKLAEIVLTKNEAQIQEILEYLIRHIAKEVGEVVDEVVLAMFLQHFKIFTDPHVYLDFLEQSRGKKLLGVERLKFTVSSIGETRGRAINLEQPIFDKKLDLSQPFIIVPYIFVAIHYPFLSDKKKQEKIVSSFVQALWFAAEKFFHVQEAAGPELKQNRARQAARMLVVRNNT